MVALIVVLDCPHSLQHVEHGVTAGPLRLSIVKDGVLEIAVPAVFVAINGLTELALLPS